MTSPSDQALRDQAERYLRALAGEHALLRDDQWTAISALVADRRRALVVQRTGWGKSAVYFVATALLRDRGAGPTVIVSPLLALMRNQVAAAERAGIHARTINSANTQEWQQVYNEVAPARPSIAGQPGTAEQPGVPRPGAARAHRGSRADRDRRGTLHLGLGPRLPARLPAHPHAARDLPRGIPVLATTATANARVTGTSPNNSAPGPTTTCSCCAGRWTASRCGSRSSRLPTAPSGSAGWPPTWRTAAARVRDHLHADRRGGLRDRGVPACAGHRRHRLQRPDDQRPAPAGGKRPARQPDQGARGDQRARDGVRQA